MAKMEIKRIGVFSFAKVYAVVMAGIALVIIIPVGIISMIAGAAFSGRDAGGAVGGIFGGLMMIVLAPVIYGLMGFILGALTALIYNVASGLVGGVEFEMESTDLGYGAPPPPQQWGNQYQQPGQQQYPY